MSTKERFHELTNSRHENEQKTYLQKSTKHGIG